MNTHDLSNGNGWGRAVYPAWGSSGPKDGRMEVTGCLTPLPAVGDTVIANNGSHWTVERVNAWGNPPDGFDATLREAMKR